MPAVWAFDRTAGKFVKKRGRQPEPENVQIANSFENDRAGHAILDRSRAREATEEGGPQMIEAVIVWTVDMALGLRHACFRMGISTFNRRA
jgi:hypothetical protein